MAASHITMRSDQGSVTSTPGSPRMPSSNGWVGPPIRQSSDLSYMHRPPIIIPNYGKKYKGGLKLKTNVPRVLLYDNVTQQSMLDVQLNGINSQSYKTSRQLEMQMKSFLLRRQHKEKLLKKLTQVPHGQDYSSFERQYYGTGESDQAEGEGFHPNGVTFPNIQTMKGILKTPGKRRVKRRISQSKFMNVNINNGNSSQSLNYEEKSQSSLPLIHSASSSSLTVNSLNQNGNTQHFVPRRKVGFRFEKTSTGLTRIFHALPGSEGTDANIAVESSIDNSQEVKDSNLPAVVSDEIGVIHEANQPVQISPTGELNTSGAETGNDAGVTWAQNKNKPVLDYRFEMLQEILVRQDPPNDGFIELSPSFIRESPLNGMRERLQQLRVGRKKSGRSSRGTSRKSLMSEDVTPQLSDYEPSDSEDEKEEQFNRENSALKRLGAHL